MIQGRKTTWDVPGRVERLVVLVKAGLSAREIAIELGGDVTRNAVVGRCNRDGLSLGGNQSVKRRAEARNQAVAARRKAHAEAMAVRAQAKARTNHPPRPGQQNRPGAVFGNVQVFNPEETEAKRKEWRAYGETAIAFVSRGGGVESPNARPFLESSGCKWPLGDCLPYRYCCNPVAQTGTTARRTYCEGHLAIYAPDGAGRAIKGPNAVAAVVVDDEPVPLDMAMAA